MPAFRVRIGILLAMVLAVLALSVVVRHDPVQAQSGAPGSPLVGRFQISAYSPPAAAEQANPGCYIVDTATGRVWHTRLGAGLVEVNKKPIVSAP